jgi:DNA-binding LacI/PurR family transcriptional regulator
MPSSSTPERSRVSLRDVAREVGVSHVTVSLALRKDPRISLARQQEVQAVADRLGYRPDPMLASLSAYRQTKRPMTIRSAIAWFNQWEPATRLRSYHEFDAYWRGAHDAAEQLGYRLEEFVLKKDITPARLQKILLTRNVRGILIPPHRNGLTLPDFDWSYFSIVRFGASVKHPRAHIVTSDQTKCAALAFSRVHQHGYKHIGYVSSLEFEQNTKGNFRAGFLSSQEEIAPICAHVPPLLLTEEAGPDDARLLQAWIKKYKPDALISNISRLPRLLALCKIHAPRDIAIATLSLLDGNFDCGVDQNSYEIGRVALSTLASLIHQNERGIPLHCRRVLVEGQWKDGESLPIPAVKHEHAE